MGTICEAATSYLRRDTAGECITSTTENDLSRLSDSFWRKRQTYVENDINGPVMTQVFAKRIRINVLIFYSVCHYTGIYTMR